MWDNLHCGKSLKSITRFKSSNFWLIHFNDVICFWFCGLSPNDKRVANVHDVITLIRLAELFISDITIFVFTMHVPSQNYRHISNIGAPNLKFSMFFVSSCSCLCPIHWSQVLSWEWRCSWSSADRRCSNYIWVINNFIAYRPIDGLVQAWCITSNR